MHVKANSTPASAPGGYTWEDEASVVEVPDDLGTELVRIAGMFREVLPTDPEHPHYEAPEEEEEDGDSDSDTDVEEDDGADGEEDEGAGEDLIGVCTGQTTEGKPCKNKAKPGQDTCAWHELKE